MRKTWHLIVEIVGLLGSVIGIGILVLNELYLVGGFVVVVVLALTFLAIRFYNSVPLQYKLIKFDVKLLDKDGRLAEVKKTKRFIAKEKNIVQFHDSNITAVGTQRNF